MILVFVSGGLDSVAALHWLLTKTDRPIWAHHIRLDNFEGRAPAESKAMAAINAWMRANVRPYKYTENAVSFPLPLPCPVDADVCYFVGGQIIRHHPEVRNIVTGRCKEDDEPLSLQDGRWPAVQDTVARLGYNNITTGDARWVIARGILRAVCGHKPEDLILKSPCKDMTKAEEARLIGPELTALTWSCRKPVAAGDTWRRCGVCHSCQHLSRYAETREAAT